MIYDKRSILISGKKRTPAAEVFDATPPEMGHILSSAILKANHDEDIGE